MSTQTLSSQTDTSLIEELQTIGKQAKHAAEQLLTATTEQKNQALLAAAKELRTHTSSLIDANTQDVEQAKARDISGAFLDRLILNEQRIEAMAAGLEKIATLPDPVNEILAQWDEPNGLTIKRVRVPLGVIGVIYESRPNVTADAAALCLKSGNASILRGGSESFFSSQAILDSMQKGLQTAGLNPHAIQSIPTKDRAAVGEMLRLNDYIDVIVPRGGKGLIQRIIDESRIPTFQHLDGNCHSYIHEKADIDKAISVVKNAKLRRVGICGATESLVIDSTIAQTVLPALIDALEGCEFRGDTQAQSIDSRVIAAQDDDWSTEYLEAILSVKIVNSIEQALPFIQAHSSHHTDAIITEDNDAAQQFFNRIDSAIVMHNTSTQFADGGEFGMGAEIGIATGRLHARGPVGLEQLTTFKYVVSSDGATRPA